MPDCTICDVEFDGDQEGVIGFIGILPVAFCDVCKTGIYEFAAQTWDLWTYEQWEYEHGRKNKATD